MTAPEDDLRGPPPNPLYEDEERAALAAGYTRDPEEFAGEQLVMEPWSAELDDSGFEVRLEFDPDAYMFGKPRTWSVSMVSTDPRYPVGRRYEQESAAMTDLIQHETTERAVRELERFVGVLRKRDRMEVRSGDGERLLVFAVGKEVEIHKITPRGAGGA